MNNQIPDPTTLNSWDDAFQHPLPVVRKLEQQLRRNIDENRQKLRSLVGTSYRDLLGTAERIIEMDEQIQHAETFMGEIGRRCNARTLEKIASNHTGMKRTRQQEEQAAYTIVAQTKILQSAITVTLRMIRGKGDALVAAKVLVLARLLHKSLAESGKAPAVLEELRRKLGGARKRLLGYIEKSLVRTGDGKMTTVHTLCAYSLITSSSPRDVLRYFLQVRFEQLETKADTPSDAILLEMLDLYSQTLLDTREVFPRRFVDSLSQLAKTTLVRDVDVRSVFELSLDIYEQWITDDVRHFHPWVRHDQLSSSEVGEALASWTKEAQSCLLQGISGALKTQDNTHAVLDLRRKVLSKYLALGARIRSDGHAQAINDLRAAFLSRLQELAGQVARLADLEFDTQPKEKSKAASIWKMATDDMDLSSGAPDFRAAVIECQHGRSMSTQSIIAALDDWTSRLQEFSEAIVAMRSTRWNDDIDLDFDDLAENDSLQIVLTKQDPLQLESALQRETGLTLGDTYRKIEQHAESARDPALFVRILREVDLRRRALEDLLEKDNTLKSDEAFIATLHNRIAASVSEAPIQYLVNKLRASPYDTFNLWDGSPPLPIQPSPAVFRFMKMVHGKMSDTGRDLWSPDSVRSLKVFLQRSLGEQLTSQSVEGNGSSLTNGHSASNADQVEGQGPIQEGEAGSPETDRKRCIQRTFDVLYLHRVLQTAGGDEGGLNDVLDELKKSSALDGTAAERLRKSANEYWKRTYLLFGLLAIGHHTT